MKKKIIIALSLLFCLLFSLSLASCNDTAQDDPDSTSDNTADKITITFDSMGGSAVETITASAGEKITAPTNPVKDGFEFSGWFESADGGKTLADNEFAFGYMPAKNVTLYAGWKEVSEVGKKYAVKNYKTDVNFEFDNPDSAPKDLDPYKLMYSTMYVVFKENNAVEIFLHAELEVDNTHFYAVNPENRVGFFATAEDAKNMTNRVTDDYFGWSYQFDSSKKTLTVTARSDADGLSLTMVLTASE